MAVERVRSSVRADRLLSILLLLQVHRRMTGRQLAQRLEVSERTIHRDMVALCTSGIPLCAERGAGGGWVLPDAYRTELTGLSKTEIQALFVARPSRLLDDLGLGHAADGLLVKLLAALPRVQQRHADLARQRIHIDATGWTRREEAVPFLPVLQEAIWGEHQVFLTYQRGDDTVHRTVDPLGLVAKGSVWYLVAGVGGEFRHYRVSRVVDAILTEQPCVRPPDFDLAEHWAQASVQFLSRLPRYPVVARVAPVALSRVRQGGRYVRVERVDPPDNDGWVTILLQCETEDEASEFVLGCGPWIEVVEPRELRARVRALAEQTVAVYDRIRSLAERHT